MTIVAAAVQVSLLGVPTVAVTRPRQAQCKAIYCCCSRLCATHCKSCIQRNCFAGCPPSLALVDNWSPHYRLDVYHHIHCKGLQLVLCLGLVLVQLRGGVEAPRTWCPSQRLFGWTWDAGCMALGVLGLGYMDNCSAWDRRHAGTTCTEFGATTRAHCERSNCSMLQFLVRFETRAVLLAFSSTFTKLASPASMHFRHLIVAWSIMGVAS
jgi:hypothetical protein